MKERLGTAQPILTMNGACAWAELSTCNCAPYRARYSGSVFQRRVHQNLLKATRRIRRLGSQGPYMDSSSFANNPSSGREVRLLTYIRSRATAPAPGAGP